MRKTIFANGEYYHIYNRGVDKRTVFSDQRDVNRLIQSLLEFNTIKPIGSIYENSFRKKPPEDLSSKLVEFVAYCLNPNHYHFILKQLTDDGIKKFMHRLGGGYTMYFNKRYNRSGVLFQGRFKAVHIDTNEYLLHLSAYVNLNDSVHQLGGSTSKLVDSSWDEYMNKSKKKICNKNIILKQFRNIKEYKRFAENSLNDILEKKKGVMISKKYF